MPKAKAAPAPVLRVRGKVRIPRHLKPLYQVCSVMAKGLPMVRQCHFNDDHRTHENFVVALAGLEAHYRTLLGQDRRKRQLQRQHMLQAMRARAKAKYQATRAQAKERAAAARRNTPTALALADGKLDDQ